MFKSILASELDQFLRFKRSLGYQYRSEELLLKNFDRFVYERSRGHARRPPLDQLCLNWLASRPGRKVRTAKIAMMAIRQFWNFMRRSHPRKYSRELVWPRFGPKTGFHPHVFTSRQIHELLSRIEAMKDPKTRSLIRSIFLVLYCTGLRFGELARLRVCDVDLRRNVFFISESKGRSRWVPFHDSLGRELIAYAKMRQHLGSKSKPDEPFFIRSNARSLYVRWISYTLRSLLRRHGLKPMRGRTGPRPYDLRATFAVHRLTRWYRQGIDLHDRLAWLSAYMGHVDLAGTEVYLKATPDLLAFAANRFRRHFTLNKGVS